MKRCLFSIFLVVLILNMNAQSALKDPGIPQGETIRYRFTQKEKQEFSYQIVSIINHEGQECYLVENQSVQEISKSRILKKPFITQYLEKHLYAGRAESVKTYEILSLPVLKENEIGLLDMSDMAFLMRGYPFDKPGDMVIALMEQQQGESGGMTFRIIYRGREKITIDGIEYQAHKLEMKAELEGAMGLFSGIIPKTYFWFDAEGSHPLLKFTGSNGPGTSETLLEMVDYQG